MSQIISAIPANALLPVAGALVGWVGHMAWHHAERAHVARGMALIRRFMDGNDDWETQHRARFALTADPDVTGEVLHVEPHETGEHPAISDEPAWDELDAPADDTDRPGLWLVLLAVPVALWDRLAEWWQSLWAARRERHMVGSGEQATDGDPFAELLAHVEHDRTSEAEELALLDEQWRTAVAAARATSSPRHASDEVAQDKGYRGSRWAQDVQHTGTYPIVTIPAQREAAE